MKRKFGIIVAAILTFLLAISRISGGVALIAKGNHLVTDNPIIASLMQAKVVGFGLAIIGILLIYFAVMLIVKLNEKYWKYLILFLILFLIDGIINGFVLFGKPFVEGQFINLIAVLLIGLFLFIGKPSLKKD